jgi:hypothetical protein
MKLDIRLDQEGLPIIFFLDDWEPSQPHYIGCYQRLGQHSEAARAYMRQCRKPETPEDYSRCCSLLIEWARLPV